jgi:hypothetical protein
MTKMLKQFDHMIEPKLNLELSNVFPRLKFLAGCGQFSDFSNTILENLLKTTMQNSYCDHRNFGSVKPGIIYACLIPHFRK